MDNVAPIAPSVLAGRPHFFKRSDQITQRGINREKVDLIMDQQDAPRPGQVFNPSRKLCGFYPPDIVARQRDFTDGQKRLYERLVRWAGTKGTCWYSFETMAVKLGKCVRQVKTDMDALEERRLVSHEVRGWKDGKRQTNLYRFHWHSVFDDIAKVECSPLHSSRAEGCVQDSAELSAVSDKVECSIRQSWVQPTAQELYKTNDIRELRKNKKKRNPDYQPSYRKNRDTSADGDLLASSKQSYYDPQPYPELKEVLHWYYQEEGQEDQQPADGLVVDVMKAASKGAGSVIAEAEVIACLRRLYHERGLRPGTKNGPHRWAWFKRAVRDHFANRPIPACASDFGLTEEGFRRKMDAVKMHLGEIRESQKGATTPQEGAENLAIELKGIEGEQN